MSDRHALLAAIAAAPDDDLVRLVYADWLEERRECDRDLATAELIRLTCGLPVPKRAKWKKCNICRGVGSVEVWVGIGEGHRRLTCTCGGSGRLPNDGPHCQLYPPQAAEWLRTEWRRLLPALTEDWESCNLPKWENWLTRFWLKTGVPMAFRVHDAYEYRFYRPTVGLTFGRGFVEDCRWQAETLGPEIARRVAQDQPLASQYGPGAIVPACPHTPPCINNRPAGLCNIPLFQTEEAVE